MSNIRVSYGEIEQAAAQLGRGREEIAAKLQELHRQIGSLIGSGFATDRASVRFGEAYSEYTASANSVVDRLGEIERFLLQTSATMRDMDEQLAARIR